MTGKYESALGLQGDLAASEIAAITKNPKDSTHAAAGAALGAQWDADIAAAVPPPPPVPAFLMGSAPGAWGDVPTMVKTLDLHPMNVVRAFNPADGRAVPAGLGIAYSNDGGHANRCGDLVGLTPGSAAYTNWLAELTPIFARDDAPGYLIADHEFDIHGNNYVLTAQKYKGLNLLRDVLNQGRHFLIQTYVVTTGMVYDTTAYENLAQVPSDGIGADNYARKHWDTMAGFGKRIGRPYGCFENGIKAQTNPSTFTDTQVSAAMSADTSAAKSLGFSVFCYWPQGGNDLTKRPLSTANLKSLCAANR